MKRAGEWQSHDPLVQRGTERWHHPGRNIQRNNLKNKKCTICSVTVTAQIFICTVSLRLRTKGKSCQMSLRSDSAQCRNLSDRIPSAGTQCGANWQHRKPREAKQQADEKVRVGSGDGWGPHVQLVVDIGSVPQQSVHRLGMSVLGRYCESRAAVLQGSRQQMWQIVPGSSRFIFVATWIPAWDDHILFHNQRPCQRKPLCPTAVPLFGIRWRRRTQRGASRRHCDPAGRRRRGRSSLSGESDKNRRSCLLFWREQLSVFVWGMPKRKELKSLLVALYITKNRPEELDWDQVSGW